MFEVHPPKPAYLSVRLLWAFARVTPVGSRTFEVLGREGLGPQDLADPDTRIRHSTAMELLAYGVERSGNPALGLLAGESMESSDLDALEYAARTCDTLGDAIRCICRYVSVMNEAAQTTLEEVSERAIWSYRTVDGVPQPPAADDFAMAFGITFARRFAGIREPLLEVHLMHEMPADVTAYARIFQAPLRFNMKKNALVFSVEHLALPMQNAAPHLQKPFEARAEEVSRRFRRDEVTWRVREVLYANLSNDGFAMPRVAEKLAMSVASLRRRLEREGTSHTTLLDEARKALAQHYGSDHRLSASDVAFLLGFANVKSLESAAKRWHGDAHSFRKPRRRQMH